MVCDQIGDDQQHSSWFNIDRNKGVKKLQENNFEVF